MSIYINGKKVETNSRLVIDDAGKACFQRQDSPFHLRSEELESLNLKSGINVGEFVVESLSVTIPFNVFYYDDATTQIVVTDIDGTITTSDFRGHILPRLGLEAHHDHVVELLHKISENGIFEP